MIALKAFALIGVITVAYFGVRLLATAGDVGNRAWRRLRGDKNAWKTDAELQDLGK